MFFMFFILSTLILLFDYIIPLFSTLTDTWCPLNVLYK